MRNLSPSYKKDKFLFENIFSFNHNLIYKFIGLRPGSSATSVNIASFLFTYFSTMYSKNGI